MWKLVGTDSGYNQWVNYVQWPVILLLVIANSIKGNLEREITVAMFILAMFFAAAIGGECLKTKRIRLLAGLPVPVRSLGLYRHFGTVVGWFIWMALLFLSSMISKRGHVDLNYLCWMLAKIGSIFIFVGAMGLPTNLFFYIKDRKLEKRLIYGFVYPLLVIVGGSGLFIYLCVPDDVLDAHGHRIFWAGLSEIVRTFPGAFGVLLAGFILLALDVYCFERRRSYLEDSVKPS
jgi:hypothetical protein